MITQLAVISVFVTIIDQLMQAYVYDMSKTLSVFVGLIITNCIVMGRTEAMAKNVPPVPAFLDGLGAGLGYAVVLVLVAIPREILGVGTLYGHRIIPKAWYNSAMYLDGPLKGTLIHPDGYTDLNIMVLPPAAFFLIGGMIWAATAMKARAKK